MWLTFQSPSIHAAPLLLHFGADAVCTSWSPGWQLTDQMQVWLADACLAVQQFSFVLSVFSPACYVGILM
jgi:hypothetical protein